MVGVGERFVQGDVVEAGLLLHLAQGGCRPVLAGLDLALWEVPAAVAEDHEDFVVFVGDDAAGRVDDAEILREAGPFLFVAQHHGTVLVEHRQWVIVVHNRSFG